MVKKFAAFVMASSMLATPAVADGHDMPPPEAEQTYVDMNALRFGQTMMKLYTPDTEHCAKVCDSFTGCKSWTYIDTAFIGGDMGQCTLHTDVAPVIKTPCCTTGIAEKAQPKPVTPPPPAADDAPMAPPPADTSTLPTPEPAPAAPAAPAEDFSDLPPPPPPPPPAEMPPPPPADDAAVSPTAAAEEPTPPAAPEAAPEPAPAAEGNTQPAAPADDFSDLPPPPPPPETTPMEGGQDAPPPAPAAPPVETTQPAAAPPAAPAPTTTQPQNTEVQSDIQWNF